MKAWYSFLLKNKIIFGDFGTGRKYNVPPGFKLVGFNVIWTAFKSSLFHKIILLGLQMTDIHWFQKRSI